MLSEIIRVHLITVMCNYLFFGYKLISLQNQFFTREYILCFFFFLKISLSVSNEASIGWRGLLQNLSCCKMKWRVRTLTFVFPSSLSFLLYSSSFLYLPALCEKIPSCPILEVNETSVEFNSIPLMSLLNVNHEIVGEYTIQNIQLWANYDTMLSLS